MQTRTKILASAGVIQPKGEAPASGLPVVQVTLTAEQFDALDVQFPPRATDNPIVAAQQLGQQQVLRALRRGFVSN